MENEPNLVGGTRVNLRVRKADPVPALQIAVI
jgi:hypothetical protein